MQTNGIDFKWIGGNVIWRRCPARPSALHLIHILFTVLCIENLRLALVIYSTVRCCGLLAVFFNTDVIFSRTHKPVTLGSNYVPCATREKKHYISFVSCPIIYYFMPNKSSNSDSLLAPKLHTLKMANKFRIKLVATHPLPSLRFYSHENFMSNMRTSSKSRRKRNFCWRQREQLFTKSTIKNYLCSLHQTTSDCRTSKFLSTTSNYLRTRNKSDEAVKLSEEQSKYSLCGRRWISPAPHKPIQISVAISSYNAIDSTFRLLNSMSDFGGRGKWNYSRTVINRLFLRLCSSPTNQSNDRRSSQFVRIKRVE